jgi:hypothetical protein
MVADVEPIERDGEPHAKSLCDRLLARPKADDGLLASTLREELNCPSLDRRAYVCGESLVRFSTVRSLDVNPDTTV